MASLAEMLSYADEKAQNDNPVAGGLGELAKGYIQGMREKKAQQDQVRMLNIQNNIQANREMQVEQYKSGLPKQEEMYTGAQVKQIGLGDEFPNIKDTDSIPRALVHEKIGLKEAQAKLGETQNKKTEMDKKQSDDEYAKAYQYVDSTRNDQTMKTLESQTIAAQMAGDVIRNAKKQGRNLNRMELTDTAGQLWKARTGGVPSDEVLKNTVLPTLLGSMSKVNTFLSSNPTAAVSDDYQKALEDFVDTSGKSSQDIYNNLMQKKKTALSGFGKLNPDQRKTLEDMTRIQYSPLKGEEQNIAVGNKKKSNPKSIEIKRKTKDGKIAVFDETSKKFLRYENGQ